MTTLSENIIYRRVAPLLLVLTFVLAIGAVVGTYVNDRNDRARDRAITAANTERIKDNGTLLGCVDDVLAQLTGALPPVREASAARNATITEVFDSLRAILIRAIAAGDEEIPEAEGLRLVTRLATALEAYEKADAALLQSQADNPYPDPPSEFCKLPS